MAKKLINIALKVFLLISIASFIACGGGGDGSGGPVQLSGGQQGTGRILVEGILSGIEDFTEAVITDIISGNTSRVTPTEETGVGEFSIPNVQVDSSGFSFIELNTGKDIEILELDIGKAEREAGSEASSVEIVVAADSNGKLEDIDFTISFGELSELTGEDPLSSAVSNQGSEVNLEADLETFSAQENAEFQTEEDLNESVDNFIDTIDFQ